MPKQNNDSDKNQKKFINSLSDKQKKAFEIAEEHLKSSFNLNKSLGYIEYNKNNK